MKRIVLNLAFGLPWMTFILVFSCAAVAVTAEEQREIAPGITTQRLVQGEPYELAGKRLVFLDWYYVHPGKDADWRFPDGASARVAGSADPYEAHFRHENHAYGIRLVVQPAKRVGPIVKPEKPWESTARKSISFSTVMQDEGKYRAWGSCDTGMCYFESKDGMDWQRPDLGQVDFAGNRQNNLLASADGVFGVFKAANVFKDPVAPPAERYKNVVVDGITRKEFEKYQKERPGPDAWEPRALIDVARGNDSFVWAIRGSVSPDGLHWALLPRALSVEFSDTGGIAYYDQVLRKYVMYTRWWSVGPHTGQLPPDIINGWYSVGRRSIGRSETSVFRSFPVSEVIYEATSDMQPSDVLYTSCRSTVPGAPDHHLMFPAVWHQDDDTTTLVLLSSRDGRLWQRVPGPPVLDTASFGKWDGGCVFAVPNLLELPDGSFALPYGGWNLPHKYARGQLQTLPGYAVWPKGRIVALEAVERGEFAMVALMPPGRKLLINALTKRAGEIRVQVDGVAGRSLDECDPIIGDQYRTVVTWKGQSDLGHEQGRPIRLRFRMEKTQLFGLEFE